MVASIYIIRSKLAAVSRFPPFLHSLKSPMAGTTWLHTFLQISGGARFGIQGGRLKCRQEGHCLEMASTSASVLAPVDQRQSDWRNATLDVTSVAPHRDFVLVRLCAGSTDFPIKLEHFSVHFGDLARRLEPLVMFDAGIVAVHHIKVAEISICIKWINIRLKILYMAIHLFLGEN